MKKLLCGNNNHCGKAIEVKWISFENYLMETYKKTHLNAKTGEIAEWVASRTGAEFIELGNDYAKYLLTITK